MHSQLYVAVAESMPHAVSELQAPLEVKRLLARRAAIVESAWSNGEDADRTPTVKSVCTPSSWR